MLTPILIASIIILASGLVVLMIRKSSDDQRADIREEETRAQHAEHLLKLTERLEAERKALLNALSDPFFLIDTDGIIRFANSRGQSMFASRNIINRKLEEVFLDGRMAAPIREALEAKTPITTQVILSRQTSPLDSDDRPGETAWLIDARPVELEGSRELMRVLIRDKTDEHHTEQVRKDFVANASHELRTPLAIINGYLENLIDENMLDDKKNALRFLKIMRKHGKRITRIVEDMLIISRLESGEAGSLKVKPFRLEACVQDVVERLESMISNQRAKVELATTTPDLRLLGDRFYWTQVLFNLVENALKQNPEIPLHVEVGWEEGPETLTIWVEDNGVGIPSADLPFIFRRFYRVEKHHSQIEIKGTGLGLSIVRRAVEAHGGEIEVSSTPGQQTRFEMTLPKESIAPDEPTNGSDPEEAHRPA